MCRSIEHALVLVVGLCVALSICVSPGTAGDVYGDIRLREYETEKERPLSRQVRIIVQTTAQLIETTSRPGSTYYMSIPEEGRFDLTVFYSGLELTAQIGSYYNPNRNNLIILHKDGQHRLYIESTHEWRHRPQDKDPE